MRDCFLAIGILIIVDKFVKRWTKTKEHYIKIKMLSTVKPRGLGLNHLWLLPNYIGINSIMIIISRSVSHVPPLPKLHCRKSIQHSHQTQTSKSRFNKHLRLSLSADSRLTNLSLLCLNLGQPRVKIGWSNSYLLLKINSSSQFNIKIQCSQRVHSMHS
jgi:hypothetical protein